MSTDVGYLDHVHLLGERAVRPIEPPTHPLRALLVRAGMSLPSRGVLPTRPMASGPLASGGRA